MLKDFRQSAFYREAEALHTALRQPGSGKVSDAADICASPTSQTIVFSGFMFDKLEGTAQSRICEMRLDSGEMRVLTFGPHTDRLPKYSPDGKQVAFLSDRDAVGDFQLYILDCVTGFARPAARVEGWVEYFHWSPDGGNVLLGVASHGADVSGGQGAISTRHRAQALPSWMPTVDSGDDTHRWRSAWILDLSHKRLRQANPDGCNVWEAAWCGSDAVVAVDSPGPKEGLWYEARLQVLDIKTGQAREIYAPQDQLGWPSGSPSGKRIAVVEALCSDRWIVAGDLRIIDVASKSVVRVDTHGVDITYTEWRSDRVLLVAGHRGFDTVIGIYDCDSQQFHENWCDAEMTGAGRYITVSGIGAEGDCAFIGEKFTRAPEIAIVRSGQYRCVKSFDSTFEGHAEAGIKVEQRRWSAPDGMEIHGWLLTLSGSGPYPLVMNVHGGPVWHWRPTWLGRPRNIPMLMLLNHGYAVFLPNPRGSAGRGQAFARLVKGDVNGADTFDLLSGLNHLVDSGIADRSRLGVTGVSYGGGMTSWLITQVPLFAAAVSISPHTNQLTEHLISNIPHFVSLFVGDHYTNTAGKYFERSPVLHAHKTKTPTLNIAGALDRCTPAEEAVQFHNALLENGVTSELVVYPEEGHGVQKFPALIDYAARLVAWFEEYMPSR